MRVVASAIWMALFLCIPVMGMGQQTEITKEEIIDQARRLIEGNRYDKNALQQGIDLLKEVGTKPYSDERIPLLLAEAHYRLADPEADIDQVWPIYEVAGDYAEQARELAAKKVPAELAATYWHGLVELKRAQKGGGIGAYFTTRRAIRELEKVREFLPGYDEAGASRVLSLLYRVAPGWSPFGDIEKAVDYGEEAVRIEPQSPVNRLYLARAYLKDNQPQRAADEFRKILELAPNQFEDEAKKQLKELKGVGRQSE